MTRKRNLSRAACLPFMQMLARIFATRCANCAIPGFTFVALADTGAGNWRNNCPVQLWMR